MQRVYLSFCTVRKRLLLGNFPDIDEVGFVCLVRKGTKKLIARSVVSLAYL